MPPRLRSRSFKLKPFWSFRENLGMFITHLLGFYISVFTLCPSVNFLCCAYMTNLFMQKVKVTESKHLEKSKSSSLRVFVQNLFLFTMFFNVHMIMFCFSFYRTNFLNCVQSGAYGHIRKLVKMLLKTYFSRIQGYIYPHIVAVMSLYLVFVGHSLQCLSKTTTVLHQSISSVKVKVILGEQIVGPKMIFI